MKTLGIIFNICALLVSIFFVVFAQIQTQLAQENKYETDRLRRDAVELVREAERAMSRARASEAKALNALMELEECQEGN